MSYPISDDKKIQKLSNLLTRYAETQGVEFSFGGQEVYPMETFAHFGALPLFLGEAKEIYEKIYNNLYSTEDLMSEFGKKLKKLSLEESLKEQEFIENIPIDKKFPIEFMEKTEDTYFGFIPVTSSDMPADFFLISHFSMYALEEYLKIYKKNKLLLIEGKIPLDPLYEKLVNKINSRKIRIIASPSLEVNNLVEKSSQSNISNESGSI